MSPASRNKRCPRFDRDENNQEEDKTLNDAASFQEPESSDVRNEPSPSALAIMVHKLFADRVVEALLRPPRRFHRLLLTADPESHNRKTKETAAAISIDHCERDEEEQISPQRDWIYSFPSQREGSTSPSRFSRKREDRRLHTSAAETETSLLTSSSSISPPLLDLQDRQDPSTVTDLKKHIRPLHCGRRPKDVIYLLDTPALTGVSRARRGYVLLLIGWPPLGRQGEKELFSGEGGGVISSRNSIEDHRNHDSVADHNDGDLFDMDDDNKGAQSHHNRLEERAMALSALARQNISWMGRVSHHGYCCIDIPKEVRHHLPRGPLSTSQEGSGEFASTLGAAAQQQEQGDLDRHHSMNIEQLSGLGDRWWKALTHDPRYAFDLSTDWLKVQCHPRSWTDKVCSALQRACRNHIQQVLTSEENLMTQREPGERVKGQGDPSTAQEDPLDGPIRLTPSRSKRTHRLTVILVPAGHAQTPLMVRTMADLNHQALPLDHPTFRMDDDCDEVDGDEKSLCIETQKRQKSQERRCPDETNRQERGLETGNTGCDDDVGRPLKGNSLKYNEVHHCFWGLEKSSHDSDWMDLALNHAAADEILVKPCDNRSGAELNADAAICLPTTPLSRAYYKLEEVFNEHLPKSNLEHNDVTLPLHGSALDLGASPGGWTQALLHVANWSRVVAVDTATLGMRIAQHPAVTYLPHRMETANLAVGAPYSFLGCDASLIWSVLLESILIPVVRRTKWTLPSMVVLTLKLPFKTLKSVQRQLEWMHEDLPRHLRAMVGAMYGSDLEVDASFRVIHLMANSDSERTLLAIFRQPSVAVTRIPRYKS